MEPAKSSNQLFTELSKKHESIRILTPFWKAIETFDSENAILFIMKYYVISKVNEQAKKSSSQEIRDFCQVLVKDLSEIRTVWKDQSQEEKYSYMNLSFYLYVEKLDDIIKDKKLTRDLLMK